MFEGLRFRHWQVQPGTDDIVVLILDRADAPVNAFSREVIDELGEIVERVSFDPPKGIVLASGKKDFGLGADLDEFAGYARTGKVLDAIENGQRVFENLARLPCPTIAAIHGQCLGGATELALACDQRIASDDPDTKIGLPEVNLGIHPGWGGTARLPRLIGAPEALKLMLTGRSLSARAARSMGLVDATCKRDELIERATSRLRGRRERPFAQRAKAWATNLWPVRQVLAPVMRKQTAAKARPEHYPAPFALIEVWRKGGDSIEERLKLEARSIARLAKTPTCANLMRVFFLQRQLKNLGADTDAGINHVHVVGAGVMGGDIAAWCALRGFDVTLQDREMQYIQPALDRASKLFEKRLKTPERIEPARKRLVADVEGKGIAEADLVIEAIFEDAEAKEALYRSTEPKMKDTALLATNTSSIPLDELRSAVDKSQRFLGLHYFNPVASMPLVEVVRHDQLDANIEKRALALCRKLGKLPLPVAGTPGFLVNRILMPYLLEAMRLYNEGVPGPVLDRVARKFGMPMGPMELADTIGLDVCASVGKELGPFLGLDIPPGMADRIDAKHRGKKDGEGFYKWEDGKPLKPEVPKDYVAPSDLEDRLILPMINEAVACLHDGVVDNADLADAGVIFGTGFAPFRGGPINYVRETGVDAVKARLEALANKHGDRFKPKPGWDAAVLREPGPLGAALEGAQQNDA